MKKQMLISISLGTLLMFTGCSMQEINRQKNVENIPTTEAAPSETLTPAPTPVISAIPSITPAEGNDIKENSEISYSENSSDHGGTAAQDGDADDDYMPDQNDAVSDFSLEEATAEKKSVAGYVLSTDGDIIYIDTVNTEGRTYSGEGNDRAIAFDISNASVDAPCEIKRGITVFIDYYVSNGTNIATDISSDGDEKEPRMPEDEVEYWDETMENGASDYEGIE